MTLLLNILLALSWIALTGQFTPMNFVAGFLLSYFMLRLVQPSSDQPGYFHRASRLLKFTLFYLKEFFLANFRVALTVLSPKMNISPAIVAVPLAARTNLSIVVLANLITLTPGTLTMDISDDQEILYVHSMYTQDVEQFRREIKNLERRVIEVTE
jgi:multicomponent Na+:H+ antiporter subunit E